MPLTAIVYVIVENGCLRGNLNLQELAEGGWGKVVDGKYETSTNLSWH